MFHVRAAFMRYARSSLLGPGLGLFVVWTLTLLSPEAATVPPRLPKPAQDAVSLARVDSNLLGRSEAIKRQSLEMYGKRPLAFEPNQGQADARVDFLSRGRGYTLLLSPTEVGLSLLSPKRAKRTQQTASRFFPYSTASAFR